MLSLRAAALCTFHGSLCFPVSQFTLKFLRWDVWELIIPIGTRSSRTFIAEIVVLREIDVRLVIDGDGLLGNVPA